MCAHNRQRRIQNQIISEQVAVQCPLHECNCAVRVASRADEGHIFGTIVIRIADSLVVPRIDQGWLVGGIVVQDGPDCRRQIRNHSADRIAQADIEGLDAFNVCVVDCRYDDSPRCYAGFEYERATRRNVVDILGGRISSGGEVHGYRKTCSARKGDIERGNRFRADAINEISWRGIVGRTVNDVSRSQHKGPAASAKHKSVDDVTCRRIDPRNSGVTANARISSRYVQNTVGVEIDPGCASQAERGYNAQEIACGSVEAQDLLGISVTVAAVAVHVDVTIGAKNGLVRFIQSAGTGANECC